jgi:hypothetical protein
LYILIPVLLAIVAITALIPRVRKRTVVYKVSSLVAKVTGASFLICFRSDVTSIYRSSNSFVRGFSYS